jgi:hypothetical protein
MSWVTKIAVRPSSRRIDANSCWSVSRVSGSSAPERLVEQHQARSRRERAREPDALRLAARERARPPIAIGGRIERDAREQLVDARGDVARAPAEQRRRDPDVLGDGEVREQPDLLEAVADPPAQERRGLRARVGAVDPDAAAGRLDQPVHEPQRRGLAGARAADQHEQLAALDHQRQVVDRDPLRIAPGERSQLDHVLLVATQSFAYLRRT